MTTDERKPPSEPEPLAEGTLISHLLELRDRLLRSVIAVFIAFVPLALFQNELFTLIARPLIDKLPKDTSLHRHQRRRAVHGAAQARR